MVLLYACATPIRSSVTSSPSPSQPTCVPKEISEIQLPIAFGRHIFYAAPEGTLDGDGSLRHPWDLASALSGTRPIEPGDTLWLRGGMYTGSFESWLTGSEAGRIIVRQYPGERATINGNLIIHGAWTSYWGFEVTNTSQELVNEIMVFGPHTAFINLVVHDSNRSGFGIWSEAPDSEIYGSIIYNNGTTKLNHGIYVQNQIGTKKIVDNIIFNQSGYGIHGYGLAGEYLHGFEIEGNVAFNNGTLSQDGPWPNILVGGDTPAENIVLSNNYTYQRTPTSKTNVDIGYETTANKVVSIEDNYFAGGSSVLHIRDWDQIVLSGNTFYGSDQLVELQLPRGNDPAAFRWNANTYLADGTATAFRFADQDLTFTQWQQTTHLDPDSQFVVGRPTGVHIFVRPNVYEAGRANIIVYNWDLHDTADVDLSTVLKPGDQYTIWNVQDYFGLPVTSGIFDGSPVHLLMIGVQPPRPIHQLGLNLPVTGPEFNVFILTRADTTVPTPTATVMAQPTCTPKSTPTNTLTDSPTSTPTSTLSSTPTNTPTSTPTNSVSPTNTLYKSLLLLTERLGQTNILH
jgi:hypothetical protein